MTANILEQVLLFFPLMLGIMLSFHILKLTDLTVDGSFVLGAAVCAKLLSKGCSVTFCLVMAIFAGCLTGFLVGMMQAKNRMNCLMASILSLFMLYSINFQIMGKPNINLLNTHTIFEYGAVLHLSSIEILILSNLFILMFLYLILSTRLGLLFRALGDNPEAVKTMGFPIDYLRGIGLLVSNGLASFCGAMVAQINGFADLHMGIGLTLIGIGAVVIGSELINKLNTIPKKIHYLSCGFIGSLVYFSLLNFLLKYGVDPIQVKLVMGMLLVLVLSKKTTKHLV